MAIRAPDGANNGEPIFFNGLHDLGFLENRVTGLNFDSKLIPTLKILFNSVLLMWKLNADLILSKRAVELDEVGNFNPHGEMLLRNAPF